VGGSNIIAGKTIITLRRSAAAGLVVLMISAATACGGGGGDGVATRTARPARKTPSGPCTIARADIDGDGTVSIFDITKVSAHYGEKIPPAPPELDQDGDGAITILDLNLVTSVFVRQIEDCP
jgi:hypothetical protein